MRSDPQPNDRGSNKVGEPTRIVMYQRKGCVFCALLRRQLRRTGLPVLERDIWADADAAAFVRRHADGNETVPTVDVAGTVLVNPSVGQVVALARAAGIVGANPPPRSPRRR